MMAAPLGLRANVLFMRNSTNSPIDVNVRLFSGQKERSVRISPQSSDTFLFVRPPKHQEATFEIRVRADANSVEKTCGYIDFSPTVHAANVSRKGRELDVACRRGWSLP